MSTGISCCICLTYRTELWGTWYIFSKILFTNNLLYTSTLQRANVDFVRDAIRGSPQCTLETFHDQWMLETGCDWTSSQICKSIHGSVGVTIYRKWTLLLHGWNRIGALPACPENWWATCLDPQAVQHWSFKPCEFPRTAPAWTLFNFWVTTSCSKTWCWAVPTYRIVPLSTRLAIRRDVDSTLIIGLSQIHGQLLHKACRFKPCVGGVEPNASFELQSNLDIVYQMHDRCGGWKWSSKVHKASRKHDAVVNNSELASSSVVSRIVLLYLQILSDQRLRRIMLLTTVKLTALLAAIGNVVAHPTSSELVSRQASANKGAVASESDICSKIGVDIIEKGGNAADALVATNICIGVVGKFQSFSNKINLVNDTQECIIPELVVVASCL